MTIGVFGSIANRINNSSINRNSGNTSDSENIGDNVENAQTDRSSQTQSKRISNPFKFLRQSSSDSSATATTRTSTSTRHSRTSISSLFRQSITKIETTAEYKEQISLGMSHNFATVYTQEVKSGKDPNYAKLFASLSTSKIPSPEPRAVADAATEKINQGYTSKSSMEYARLVHEQSSQESGGQNVNITPAAAEVVLNRDGEARKITHSGKAAVVYVTQISAGHSETYANAFATAKSINHPDRYAQVYATHIDSGLSTLEAAKLAENALRT